ncbi:MAG: amidohydrolase family protein [Actinomycetota bacterium]
MTIDLPGFVDHHTHLLRVATETASPCDYSDPTAIAAYHRRVAAAGSTPMDEPPAAMGVSDVAGAIGSWLTRAARLGLVEITEAGLSDWGHYDALRELRERGPLPTRVRILVASGAASDEDRMARTGDPWLDVIGVKFYADGWLGPRTCALCRPFHDRPDDDGVLFLDAETLARRAAPFAEAGWVIATHAIGDRAIEAVLDAYQLVFGDGPAAVPPRIEHAQVIQPDLVARMAAQGVVACIQPGFASSDAEHVEQGLGPERGRTAYDWRAMIDAGVDVVAGSDFPIEPLAPLLGLQRVVVGPPAKLPLATALSIMTDSDRGTTVLATDPSLVPPDAIAAIDVVETRPAPMRNWRV